MRDVHELVVLVQDLPIHTHSKHAQFRQARQRRLPVIGTVTQRRHVLYLFEASIGQKQFRERAEDGRTF